ncbi:MAG: outer membrane protein assembly factor BamB [Wenzhouxiangellaceae bacterium]|nr:outer membrane protein assembly factor BamB [Wenzhouxiangellaceae bacterium]
MTARLPFPALLALAGAALLLGGCGIFGEKDSASEPAELIEFRQTLNVDEVWSTSVGKGAGRALVSVAPVYVDGRVWVADAGGSITAVDPDSGDKLREIETDFRISAGPTVTEDSILFGTMNGQLVKMDRASGEVQWRAQLSSEILARPLLGEGIVVARCIDGRVFGLDAESGRRQWVYDRSVPLLTLRGNSAPLIRAGQVFIGYDDGTVVALDLTDGARIWEQRVSVPEGRTQLDRLADIDGPMAIVGLDLMAVSRHGRMASLALDSGRLLWVKDLASHSGLTVSRTQLASTALDDTVWLVDRRSGSTLWTNEQLARRELTRPVFQGGFVVVADGLGYLHWLDGETGEFRARGRAGKNEPATAPLVVGNMLFLLDVEGRLSAWRAGAS